MRVLFHQLFTNNSIHKPFPFFVVTPLLFQKSLHFFKFPFLYETFSVGINIYFSTNQITLFCLYSKQLFLCTYISVLDLNQIKAVKGFLNERQLLP